MKVWLQALRIQFLTASAVPVILGGVLAWFETGLFSWWLFLATLLGVSLLHLGTNLSNDYFDHHSKNDTINKIFWITC